MSLLRSRGCDQRAVQAPGEMEVGGETTDSEPKPNEVVSNGTAQTSRWKRMEAFFRQKDLPDGFIHFTDEGSEVCGDMLKLGLR